MKRKAVDGTAASTFLATTVNILTAVDVRSCTPGSETSSWGLLSVYEQHWKPLTNTQLTEADLFTSFDTFYLDSKYCSNATD